MYKGPPPAYHPSRTRGVRLGEKDDKGDEERLLPNDKNGTDNGRQEKKRKICGVVSLWFIEALSAFLSLCGLIAAVVLYTQNPDLKIVLSKIEGRVIVTEDRNGINATNEALITAYNLSYNNLSIGGSSDSETCNSGIASIGSREYKRDGFNNTFSVVHVVEDLDSHLNPWWMLIFVLFMSVVFQTYRFRFGKGWTKWEPLSFKEEKGVNILRWLEYAVTSPFQIILIAWTFDVLNEDILAGLAVAQLGLVLLGSPIEIYISKYYKNKIKAHFDNTNSDKETHNKKINQNFRTALILFLLATTIHVFIWRVLFERKNDNIAQLECVKHNFKQNKDDEMVKAIEEAVAIIDSIVVIEVVLFSSFAGALLYSFYNAYNASFENLTKQSAEDKMHTFNYKINGVYAILSVSSKLALEILLILLVNLSKDRKD